MELPLHGQMHFPFKSCVNPNPIKKRAVGKVLQNNNAEQTAKARNAVGQRGQIEWIKHGSFTRQHVALSQADVLSQLDLRD